MINLKDITKNIIENLNNFDIFLGALSETISIYVPLACLILLTMNNIFPLYIMLLVYVMAFTLYYILTLLQNNYFNSSCIKEGELLRAFLQKYI
jgi:hypothetical protein